MQSPRITVISGTDRVDNNTEKVAAMYLRILNERNIPAGHLRLRELPRDLDRWGTYGAPSPFLRGVIEEHLRPVRDLVFIVPEYNGSFPGVLKLFLDLIPPKVLYGKRSSLVGVSDGQSGNLRGLDQLAAVFHYLRMDVLWFKPRLAAILAALDGRNELDHPPTQALIADQIDLIMA
ncbi:MAG: NAD(P)H-dependent oxidoreductase [Flavobacteriales bacterium]|nr:NAD(P)H-dependent oxidoreductase [Flavobacteriales bacterium]